jgi:hypothetical protein
LGYRDVCAEKILVALRTKEKKKDSGTAAEKKGTLRPDLHEYRSLNPQPRDDFVFIVGQGLSNIL